MPNSLTGENTQLQWSDFLGHPPANPPGNRAAFTSTDYNISNFNIVKAYAAIGLRVPDALSDLGYVVDNLRISVTLNRTRMWSVRSAQTAGLLAHEQGHYEIVALTMTDLFHDLVSPITVLLTPQAVQQYATDLMTEAARRIRVMESSSVQDGLYDSQTNHGLIAAAQASWSAAFSLARPPTGMRFDLSLQAYGIAV